MTQAASIKKTEKRISAPTHNGIFLARTNIRLFVITLAMHLLALPLILLTIIINIGKYHYLTNYNEIYIYLGILCTAIGAVMGIGVALSFFRELFDKQVTDMRLSLPMSSTQRFLSQYVSGLIIYLVPFFIAQIFSVILLLIGYNMFDGKEFTINYEALGISYDPALSPMTWKCDIFSESIIPISIKLIIGGTIIMLMIYTVFIFAMTCCGNLFETVVYGVAAELLFPAMLMFFYSCVVEHIGYGMGLSDGFYRVIGCTSPAGGIFGLISALDEQYISDYTADFAPWAVTMLMITAVYFAAAFILYRRRKAETTGKSFAFKPFFYVNLLFISVTVVSVMAYVQQSEDILPMIAASAVIYILLEIASNRGVKNIKSLGFICLRYVIIGGISLAVYFVPVKTNMLGRVFEVPDVNDIASAEITYCGTFGTGARKAITLTAEDELSLAVNAHQAQLAAYKYNHNESEYYYYYGGSMDTPTEYKWARGSNTYSVRNGQYCQLVITYKLKNGTEFSRYYSELYNGTKKALVGIDLLEQYKTEYINEIGQSITDTVINYKENRNAYLEKYKLNESSEYDFLYQLNVFNRFEGGTTYDLRDLPDDFGEQLIACLTEDINSSSDEAFYHDQTPDFGTLSLPNSYIEEEEETSCFSILIKGCYKNTIEYLESINVTAPACTIYNMGGIGTFSEEDTGYCSMDIYPDPILYLNDELISKYFNDLMEIAENSVSAYIPDKAGYTILIGGNYAYICDEYQQKAEEIFKAAAAESANKTDDAEVYA